MDQLEPEQHSLGRPVLVQGVREGEREVAGLVELRRQQECNIKLTWSYPEADREVGTGVVAAREAAHDGPTTDYLSSFLPARLADSPSAVMTAAEAKEARAKCMQVNSTCVLAKACSDGCTTSASLG